MLYHPTGRQYEIKIDTDCKGACIAGGYFGEITVLRSAILICALKIFAPTKMYISALRANDTVSPTQTTQAKPKLYSAAVRL